MSLGPSPRPDPRLPPVGPQAHWPSQRSLDGPALKALRTSPGRHHSPPSPNPQAPQNLSCFLRRDVPTALKHPELCLQSSHHKC